jgi:hypothetical protein
MRVLQCFEPCFLLHIRSEASADVCWRRSLASHTMPICRYHTTYGWPHRQEMLAHIQPAGNRARIGRQTVAVGCISLCTLQQLAGFRC